MANTVAENRKSTKLISVAEYGERGGYIPHDFYETDDLQTFSKWESAIIQHMQNSDKQAKARWIRAVDDAAKNGHYFL